jgi:putative DNA primase/helicase
MRRVPFVHTVSPAKKDPQLENKLKAPAVQSAILSWAVDGYQQWVTQGLGTCAAIEASNREYKADMDRFEGFLEELEFEPGGQIAVALLRPKYVRWCEEQGVRPLPPREFNKRLEARGPVRAKLHGAVYWTGVMCPDSIGAPGKPN